jgi:hypothetical protein
MSKYSIQQQYSHTLNLHITIGDFPRQHFLDQCLALRSIDFVGLVGILTNDYQNPTKPDLCI